MNILVVDREEDGRAALAILQQTPGNEIFSVQTGEEALALAQNTPIDLLITEVFLEPMNGFTLRNKMENRHRGIRTIFLSAYDLSPYTEHTEGYEILAKPATPQSLFPAIARTMTPAPEPPAAPAPPPEPAPEAEPEPAPPAPAEQLPLPSPDFEPAAPAPAPVVRPVNVESAIPAATPVAVPKATPAPTAVPRPAVAPVAVPRATPGPTATPTAVPRPAAAPVAVPKATPGPTATPTAVPKATPAPTATPTVVPRPAAGPVGVPKATAAPTATPTAVPRPAAVPAAAPVATPQPAARPAVAKPEGSDPLLGKTLGSYRIQRHLGKGKWGPVYLAIQTSMNRPVAMELLSADVAADEAARSNFVATARAKAAVQHPHILSVYEADQAEGRYFYTHEYVDGLTLAQLASRGEGLSEVTALQTIKCVAQGLSHLHHQKISHVIPDATDIYIGTDGLSYLSNVAQPGGEMPSSQEEICILAQVIRSVLPGGQAGEPGLQAMLNRMAIATQSGFQSWAPLFQTIQAIEPKVVPVDAFKLSAQDQAAIRAVEAARKRQKLAVTRSIAGICVFLCLLAAGTWWEYLRPEAQAHDYSNEMVEIPAGPFVYQAGQKLTLPTFYIDKYEVTMAEYEKFLKYLSSHGDTTEFDNPLQPHGRSHVPRDWEIYYGRAGSPLSRYRTVRGVPITLDCPVFNVDYFDAYAYAKWKGRRLPTEQEWEKAARGATGNLYPWGNEWDPQKLNAGTDYQADPAPDYVPAVDGYTWWAPVDALPSDRSPYGVIGMAGNVSEWTDSWDPGKTFVIVRGGNFKSNSEQALLTSALKVYPDTYAQTLGFRTASDTAPSK